MGPKFSSASASASSGNPVMTVGSKKKPLFWPCGRPPPVSILPPLALASAMSSAYSADPQPDGGSATKGVQPLCAWYSVRCLPAIERALSSADRSLRGLLGSVRTDVISADEVRRCGEPDVIFFNVNRRDDLARAEIIARSTDARP